MLSKEDTPFYSPCPLAEYIEGSVSRDSLFLRDRAFYDANRITTLFGCPVVAVDTAARRVRYGGARGGEIEGYDRLLIAAGAAPIMPPIPGLRDTPGVFAMKTLADADGILSHARGARRAVVIGSGFIGLEAAQGLLRRGLQVTVVEAVDQVLPRMLDAEMAGRVRRRLESHGMDVLVSSPAEAVLGGVYGVRAVQAGGREIPCDLVVCAAGVRADLPMLEGSGLATAKGVVVDYCMRTSQPDVYAAGDIVELNGGTVPNWPNAVSTGRVAGANMMGVDRRHAGLETFNVVRIFDVPVASFGAVTGDHILRWESGSVIRKVVVTDGKIAGAQLWGDVNGAGLYHEMMKKGYNIIAPACDIPSPRFGYGSMLRPARAMRAAGR
jgi:NAD(P)H-nitrite reductase large subunit